MPCLVYFSERETASAVIEELFSTQQPQLQCRSPRRTNHILQITKASAVLHSPSEKPWTPKHGKVYRICMLCSWASTFLPKLCEKDDSVVHLTQHESVHFGDPVECVTEPTWFVFSFVRATFAYCPDNALGLLKACCMLDQRYQQQC